jgi:RHO1 GDP-GTP exchange protein 1/2
MLEEFGIFLVLADKVSPNPHGSIRSNALSQALFAYHIEALVPSSPHAAASNHVPQKLNGTKDVHFFSVGTLQGRTLVAYMKKKGVRVLHFPPNHCANDFSSSTVSSECLSQ